MARLLANGEQYFTDNDGAPLIGGKVFMYFPSTTDFKDTWQDSDEGVLNTNPVILDSAGRAIIYGVGTYRQYLTDADDNLIWDQLTSTFDSSGAGIIWCGRSTGTGNAQILDSDGAELTSLVGILICWLAGATNTGAMQVTLDDFDPYFAVKDTDAGPAPLTGGEIVDSNLVLMMWDEDNTVYHLVEYAPNDLVLQTLKVNRLSFGNSISPTALAVDTNNWNPTGLSTTSRIRASSSVAVRLTGIVAQTPNRFLAFDNVGGFPITLASDDAGSSAGNRFGSANDLAVGSDESVILIYDNTSARWKVYATASPSVLPFFGLYCRNSVDTAHDMRVTASRLFVVNTAGAAFQLTAVDVSAAIDASGTNGLDTGSVAADTGYYLWVIYNPGTLTVAALWSLSATAPTMPSGYTYKSRVGWNVTDGASELKQVEQRGAIARYNSDVDGLPEITTGAAGDTATLVPVTIVGFLPATATIITVLAQTNQDNFTMVAPNNNHTWSTTWTATFRAAIEANIMLQSTNLYYASGSEGGSLLCLGWIDELGG